MLYMLYMLHIYLLVPGNVIMVAIDMCEKSPITGEWIYGITWKHVYFNIFVLFIVDTTSKINTKISVSYCLLFLSWWLLLWLCCCHYYHCCCCCFYLCFYLFILFIHSFIYLFIYLIFYLFICLFTYSFISLLFLVPFWLSFLFLLLLLLLSLLLLCCWSHRCLLCVVLLLLLI